VLTTRPMAILAREVTGRSQTSAWELDLVADSLCIYALVEGQSRRSLRPYTASRVQSVKRLGQRRTLIAVACFKWRGDSVVTRIEGANENGSRGR
jgi:hypothetical protein